MLDRRCLALRLTLASLVVLAPVAGLIAGCSHAPTAPKTASIAPAPPSAPQAVATYLRGCWQDRSISEYWLLPTANFRFDFASGDSSGTYYSSKPWARTDELAAAQHLFVTGTSSQPPATSITIDTTATTDAADPRPGKNPKWHRLVTMTARVRIFFAESGFEFSGPSEFFVVRGDSAQIPADLIAKGVKRDSTRWWLERWDDETLHTTSAEPAKSGLPSARAEATEATTWGKIKALYR